MERWTGAESSGDEWCGEGMEQVVPHSCVVDKNQDWDHLLPRYPSRFLSTTCGLPVPVLPLPLPLCTTTHLLASLPRLCVSTPPTLSA